MAHRPLQHRRQPVWKGHPLPGLSHVFVPLFGAGHLHREGIREKSRVPRRTSTAENFAAVDGGVSTYFNYPLQKRRVSNHYFTGVDVPLMSTEELRKRSGPDYPPVDEPGIDENGMPKALKQRREDLLKAAVRVSLDGTDATAQIGHEFMVRLNAVALSGHRFPSGFTQERTAYVHLTVNDANDFLLYQSGYLVR